MVDTVIFLNFLQDGDGYRSSTCEGVVRREWRAVDVQRLAELSGRSDVQRELHVHVKDERKVYA